MLFRRAADAVDAGVSGGAALVCVANADGGAATARQALLAAGARLQAVTDISTVRSKQFCRQLLGGRIPGLRLAIAAAEEVTDSAHLAGATAAIAIGGR